MDGFQDFLNQHKDNDGNLDDLGCILMIFVGISLAYECFKLYLKGNYGKKKINNSN